MVSQVGRAGSPPCPSKLGDLYADGRGLPEDDVRAYMWYTLSATRGDVGAVSARDRVAARMSPTQIAQARALASAWKPAEMQ